MDDLHLSKVFVAVLIASAEPTAAHAQLMPASSELRCMGLGLTIRRPPDFFFRSVEPPRCKDEGFRPARSGVSAEEAFSVFSSVSLHRDFSDQESEWVHVLIEPNIGWFDEGRQFQRPLEERVSDVLSPVQQSEKHQDIKLVVPPRVVRFSGFEAGTIEYSSIFQNYNKAPIAIQTRTLLINSRHLEIRITHTCVLSRGCSISLEDVISLVPIE